MALQIRKAERRQAKARVAFIGTSGTGKTYSSVLFARGLAGPEGRILMVDTEHHSGELYSHLTDYDYAEIEPPYETEKYIEAIRVAEENGYDVLILDSISHAWAGQGGILEQQDTIAGRGGNRFAAWGEVTPKQLRFIDAMINADIHIVVTMRAKTAYALIPDASGKTKPEKLGLAPVQREGIDYEFTLVLDIDRSHTAQASKDRTGLFDTRIFCPSEAEGAELREWLNCGTAAPAPAPAPQTRHVISAPVQAAKAPAAQTPAPTPAPAKAPERTPPKNKYLEPEIHAMKVNTYAPNGWSTNIFDKSIEEGGAYFGDGIWDKDRIDQDFKMRMAARKAAAPKPAAAPEPKHTAPTCDKCGKALTPEEYKATLAADTNGIYCKACLEAQQEPEIPKCEACGKNCTPEEARRSQNRYNTTLCPDCYLIRATSEARTQTGAPAE